MQFSTTPTLEGQTIVEYCGVVTGEASLGANIFRDFFAGIRRWGPMPSSVLISTTKRSGKTAVC